MTNIDLECAKAGFEIAEAAGDKADDKITKCLGVLQEDGVYAFFLFCKAKGYNQVVEKTIEFLKGTGLCLLAADVTKDNICEKLPVEFAGLEKLLFAKDILERALIYARYHAKVKGNKSTSSGTEPSAPSEGAQGATAADNAPEGAS